MWITVLQVTGEANSIHSTSIRVQSMRTKTHRVTTLQPSSSFKALSFSACGLALGPRLRRISFSQLRTFRPLVTYRPNEKTKSVAFRIDSSFSKFSAYYRTNPSFEYSTYGSCTVQYSIVCTFEVTWVHSIIEGAGSKPSTRLIALSNPGHISRLQDRHKILWIIVDTNYNQELASLSTVRKYSHN